MWTHRSYTCTMTPPRRAFDILETKARYGPKEMLEMRAVLQALASGGCWLAQETLSDGARWSVFTAAGRGARMVRRVRESLVEALRRQRLVAPDNEDDSLRWRISEAGRRWLAQGAPGLLAHGNMHDTAEDCNAPACEQAQGLARPASPAANAGKRRKGRKGQRRKRSDDRRDVQRLLVRDAESGALREVAVNLKENPLMWLARRKDANGQPYLEAHHVAAGERLRQDYETACMQPQITASWNPALVAADRGRLKSGPRDPFPFAERVMAARQRVQRALEDIGAELADIVVAVCCLGNGIEAAERALNWPRRSARLVLRIALERLADHYGLKPAQAQQARRWQRALHWHAEDGRPTELMPPDEGDAAARQGRSEE